MCVLVQHHGYLSRCSGAPDDHQPHTCQNTTSAVMSRTPMHALNTIQGARTIYKALAHTAWIGNTELADPMLSTQAAPPAEGPISHVITFYRNAIFTVNDGPARRVDDPANMAFIASISKVWGKQFTGMQPLQTP